MKKIFSLLVVLAIICSLCSCDTTVQPQTSSGTDDSIKHNSETDDDSIKLTVDNFEKYIKLVNQQCYGQGKYECIDDFGKKATLNWHDKIHASVELEGISSNFNYNDIKIVYKVTGSYRRFAKKPYELIKSLDVGRGQIQYTDTTMVTESFEIEVVVDTDICGNGTESMDYQIPGGYRTDSSEISYKFEVIGISGTVTPT